jgi:hypothetical protein
VGKAGRWCLFFRGDSSILHFIPAGERSSACRKRIFDPEDEQGEECSQEGWSPGDYCRDCRRKVEDFARPFDLGRGVHRCGECGEEFVTRDHSPNQQTCDSCRWARARGAA